MLAIGWLQSSPLFRRAGASGYVLPAKSCMSESGRVVNGNDFELFALKPARFKRPSFVQWTLETVSIQAFGPQCASHRLGMRFGLPVS